MKMKLPFKFMIAMLIIALAWFVIMFIYLDDLNDKPKVQGYLDGGLGLKEEWKLQTQGRFKFFIKNEVRQDYDDGADYIDDKDVVKYVFNENGADGGEKYVGAPKLNRMMPNPDRVIHQVHTKRLSDEELRRRSGIKINTGVFNGTRWRGQGKVIAIESAAIDVRRNRTMKLIQTITVPVIANLPKPQGSQSFHFDARNKLILMPPKVQNRANTHLGHYNNEEVFWGQQLDRVNRADSGKQAPQDLNIDETFKLDRQSILREVNHKAQEIEKLTFNMSHQQDKLSSMEQVFNMTTATGGGVVHKPLLWLNNDTRVLAGTSLANKADEAKRSHIEILKQKQKSTSRFRPTLIPTVTNTNQKGSMQSHKSHNDLSSDQYKDLKDSYDRHSFNVSASDGLPLNRHVPDTRPEACLNMVYNVTSLPTASVIISFHNEAWSTLLRTVHSVLNRTPMELLQEIILVNDNSTFDYLGHKLIQEISSLPKVHLFHTSKREGLAKARLYGMKQAIGEILVFLDSHCEVNYHWLEPLLSAIVRDRTKVVCPLADIIDHNNFTYNPGPDNLRGTFNWRLQFIWEHVPEAEVSHDPAKPIRTPTIGGGMFAVDKHYFQNIGALDQGMDIWGSENLELSFRVWQCGGSMEILPCSRVGHVFRPIIPYGFPGGPRQVLHRNAMRVAEVWMDLYKSLYYSVQPYPPDPEVIASLESRRQLHRRMRCHNFKWYLDHVFPEMEVPPKDALYFGQLQNEQSDWCLTSPPAGDTKSLIGNTCIEHKPFQVFSLTGLGELRHGNMCVTAFKANQSVMLTHCGHNATSWVYTKDNHLRLLSPAGKNLQKALICLDMDRVQVNKVSLSKCDTRRPTQKWKFTYHFNVERLKEFSSYRKRS